MAALTSIFGIALRHFRKGKQLSQKDLEDLTGFKKTYISSLELGEINATLKTIDELARALDRKPWELLRDPEEGPPQEKIPPTATALLEVVNRQQQEITTLKAKLEALHPIAAAYEKAGPDIRAAVESVLSVSQQELESARAQAMKVPSEPKSKKS